VIPPEGAGRPSGPARARAVPVLSRILVPFLVLLPVIGSARSSLLDVPFVPQPEWLCGGAAVAMVMRYYGERSVAADDFGRLVDRSASGISTTALEHAVLERGWTAVVLAGTPALIQRELERGRPVIALIEDHPGRLHYIVIVGWQQQIVVIHDPARNPYRVMSASVFERRWLVSANWGMVISPARPPAPSEAEKPAREVSDAVGTSCDMLVAEGVRLAQSNELQRSERLLADAAHRCPGSAPIRELAGVRLLQRRWTEVAELADEALRIDPGDAYARRLLATSRFVQDDKIGALDAWNRLNEPIVDLVHIDGLDRTRYRVVESQLDLTSGDVLTAARYARTKRRLEALPSILNVRLDFEPVSNGRADVRAAVLERTVVPRGALVWSAIGLETAASRELAASLTSVTGGGERFMASWRFWPNRPGYAIALDAPAPWGGIWHVRGFSEQQPFTDPTVVTSKRTGATLAVSDWATSRVSWHATAGLDRWESQGLYGRIGGTVLLTSGERASLQFGVDGWFGTHPFSRTRISGTWRTSSRRRGTVLMTSGGLEQIGRSAPLDQWSGGDVGHVGFLLLRAHPLLDDGRLLVERLGRRVVGATLEVQRWRGIGPAQVGAAAFLDVARIDLQQAAESTLDADVGFGLRIGLGGYPGILRADLGHGLRDGDTAFSLSWASGLR
jgi:Peptidase_C39 like family